jgi:glycosyltransferase involved in cell wall biosynthesis
MIISILIPTYNRPEILLKNLQSLNAQTVKNFCVTVIDNGSNPPVNIDEIEINYKINLSRYNYNTDLKLLINNWLKSVKGDIIIILADDDILLPKAIELVLSTFKSSSDIESLGLGFTRFSHQQARTLEKKIFSNQLYKYQAHSAALAYLSHWCIGEKTITNLPRMSHPSTSFFKRQLIDKTIDCQGLFAMTILFDVGFLGTCFNQAYLLYLDVNLAYIGTEPETQSKTSVNSPRLAWESFKDQLKLVPLKSVSHFNVAVESHLTIANIYKDKIKLDCRIRDDYYIKQFIEIASDLKWSNQTKCDFTEVLPILKKIRASDYTLGGLNLIDVIEKAQLFSGLTS